MNAGKLICSQLMTDLNVTVIRADQTGQLPSLPYITYKMLSDRDGVGQENVTYVSVETGLDEHREAERNSTISYTCYGTTNDEAFELAQALRKWFVHGGSFYLDSINLVTASVSDVQNRTTFLVNSYDEKWGLDVKLRYIDSDVRSIEYFDK